MFIVLHVVAWLRGCVMRVMRDAFCSFACSSCNCVADIYNFIDLLRDVLAGYNGTIFAYGLFKQDLILSHLLMIYQDKREQERHSPCLGLTRSRLLMTVALFLEPVRMSPPPLCPLSSPRLSSPIFSCFLAIPSLFQGEGREMPISPTKEFQAHIRAHRL